MKFIYRTMGLSDVILADVLNSVPSSVLQRTYTHMGTCVHMCALSHTNKWTDRHVLKLVKINLLNVEKYFATESHQGSESLCFPQEEMFLAAFILWLFI